MQYFIQLLLNVFTFFIFIRKPCFNFLLIVLQQIMPLNNELDFFFQFSKSF